jgi:hypothetical protein
MTVLGASRSRSQLRLEWSAATPGKSKHSMVMIIAITTAASTTVMRSNDRITRAKSIAKRPRRGKNNGRSRFSRNDSPEQRVVSSDCKNQTIGARAE